MKTYVQHGSNDEEHDRPPDSVCLRIRTRLTWRVLVKAGMFIWSVVKGLIKLFEWFG